MSDMRRFLDGLKARIVGREAVSGQADGALAEAHVARWLRASGVEIIEKNYSVRGGEIDLITRDGQTLVFVEVRMRQRRDYGGAAASITPAKRRRIILAAQHWLIAHPRHARSACRFDVVLLKAADDATPEWLKNAFDVEGRV